MKRFASVVLSSSCLFLVAGCGHGSNHDIHSKKEMAADHESTGLTLELNNGQKWQVDEHTRGSAAQMIDIIGSAAPFGSVDDARALSGAVDEELKNLIQGCTMTGPAHDQLHVFLVALFPRVEALKSKTDLEELRTIQQEMVSLFGSYERHFE